MALSIQQAAAFLNLSTSEIYKQTMRKTIPFYKVGKRVLFSEQDLCAWLEDQRQGPKIRRRVA